VPKSDEMSAQRQAALLAAMPGVFVLIWSTGFVVARYGMPHAPPMGFLAMRYALSVLAFGVWIALVRAAWPQGRAQWGHLAVTGVLMHAGYLGGVWAAVKGGIGAGTVSLIVGLQPVLTALWLSASGSAHAVSRRQWLGLLLGLGGLLLVVGHKFGLGEVTPYNLALAVRTSHGVTKCFWYSVPTVMDSNASTASARL
jgi:drug/metabolite transporter (DMT)-like permease